MSDITKDIVNTSKRLAKKSKKLSKIGKNVIKGSEDIISGTIRNTQKIGTDIYKGSKKIFKNLEKGDFENSLNNTGDLIKTTVTDVSNIIEESLNSTISNKYINLTVKIIIAIYAAFIIPNLNKSTALFFDQLIVKIIMALVIVYLSSKDPSLGIIITLAYILTLQISNKFKLLNRSNLIEPTFNNEYFKGQSQDQESEEDCDKNLLPPDNIMNITDTETNNSKINIENQESSEHNHIEPIYTTENESINNYQGDINEYGGIPIPFDTDSKNNTLAPANIIKTSNKVEGSNQNSCVKTLQNASCIQGDFQDNIPSPFSNDLEYSPI